MLRAMGNGAAGIVLALLVIVGVNVYGGLLVPVGTTDKIEKIEGLASAGSSAEPELSFAELLQQASADDGKKVAKKCVSCHTRITSYNVCYTKLLRAAPLRAAPSRARRAARSFSRIWRQSRTPRPNRNGKHQTLGRIFA